MPKRTLGIVTDDATQPAGKSAVASPGDPDPNHL